MKALIKSSQKIFFGFFVVILAFVISFSIVACEDNEEEEQPVYLESPYLICANRNPGGVGFDFVIDGKNGGVQYMDEYPEFEYDVLIKTIKVEKPDSTSGGAPAAYLYGDSSDVTNATLAFNTSSLESIGTGSEGYNVVISVTAEITAGLQADKAGFDLSGVPAGPVTGLPLMSGPNGVGKQYQKLVIGNKWIDVAKTGDKKGPSGDEQVWIVKTREGRYAKMMFTAFPASTEIGAESPTGYVAIEWDLLD